MILTMLAVIFVLMLFIGVPIGVATGFSAIIAMLMSGMPVSVAAQKMFAGVDSFTLMAIPFFVFAGDIMLEGGTSRRLINVANKLVGWIVGGLPIAGVMSAMFFAALSGSSPATVAAIGGIMIPSLKEAKYSENFAVGLMCAAGSLGIIIPPSITMLVYGVTSEESISKLFIAAVIPGIFIGLVLMVMSYIIAKRSKFVPSPRASGKEILLAVKDSIWGLMMPIIVLGGIYAGFFTPTEAAAVAIVYSLFISIVIHKELSFAKLVKVARKSIVVSSMIMFVIACANIFGYYMTFERVPVVVAQYIVQMADSKILILLSINVLLLIVGMFMDASAAVLILTPLLLPVVRTFGVDPVHFGVIVIVNLSIGMLTPPFGLNLFVGAGVSGLSLARVTRATMPFILVMLVTLMVITFMPEMSLFLTRYLSS